jgi:hypothetical protein
MGAFGSVIGIAFGIGWTILAFYLTRGSPFPFVGIVFPLGASGQPTEPTEMRLRKLEALRSTNAISPEEYQATRRRILNEM